MISLDVAVLSVAFLAERTARRVRPYLVRALTIACGLTAIHLGITAAGIVRWNPTAAVIVALAAVWIGQALIILNRTTRRDHRR